jgi:ubiquinone/menaquinone biosynthesis C-methylase UbiE
LEQGSERLPKDFYVSVLESLSIEKADSVTVLCGGPYDAKALATVGFKNVLITNVDHHDGVTDLAPYRWAYQDAENVTMADDSTDWAIVHAGLHHCASPHRGLCEMLRIARKGVVVIEARDSMLMRLAHKLGLGQEFETAPALISGGKLGGFRNTKIPNYIYRWTEREFDKAVQSYLPQYEFAFSYRYAYLIPTQGMAMSRSPVKRAIVKLVDASSSLFEVLLPKQGNRFAMIARHTDRLKPWLKCKAGSEVEVDLAYLEKFSDRSRYRKK